MMHRLRAMLQSQSAWSFYGQISYLLANFTLFLILIRLYPLEQFGNWALYITIIAIVDSIRQGLIQNGLIRALVQRSDRAPQLRSAALLINYGFIVTTGLLLWALGAGFQSLINNNALTELLRHGYRSLLALGTLQLINVLCISRQDFRSYFINNFIYGLGLIIGLIVLSLFGNISFFAVINLQVIALIPGLVYALSTQSVHFGKPDRQSLSQLLGFGKYVAGTNVLSMLFHKADVLMLAFFIDPAAVALFHFATKIVGYAELPLNALSQVIYPRLAVSYRHQNISSLKSAYIDAVFRLLLLACPLSLGVMIFKKEIISILSTGNYENAAGLIVILCLGGLFKPLGRVFGLTLDAMGKPRINFQMLGFSLIVNIIMNLTLIPLYGTTGAAIATSSSIVLTVTWGQLRLRKWIPISLQDLSFGFMTLINTSFFTKTKFI